MPPRFRLQQVLDYRERVEAIAQQELASLEQQRRIALEALWLQERQAEQQREALAAQRAHGALDPHELERAASYLAGAAAVIAARREQVAELEERVAAGHAALLAAARDRRALEQLREREVAAALDAVERREARELDELVMQRAQRSREAWEV
jgi:flagellar FliJ protein